MLPNYVRPSRTSFHSKRPLSTIVQDMTKGFQSNYIEFSTLCENFSWECSALRLHTTISFEVRVFQTPAGAHLIELRHLSGCRHSFSSVASDLALPFGVKFNSCKRPLSASDQTSSALSLPPTLRRSTTQPSQRESSEAEKNTTLSGRTNDNASASHLSELLAPGAGVESLTATCRAVGAFAEDVRSRQATTLDPQLLQNVRSRLVELSSLSEGHDETLRATALAATASLVALEPHVCLGADSRCQWVKDAADLATAIAVSSDELVPPYVLNEAHRLSTSVACR